MMNIAKYAEVINSCRYCFMCRHLAATGNVTFRESDTPRVRSVIMYTALHDKNALADPDVVRGFYECDLSRACTRHCVSSYDENSLLLAARRDMVENNFVPENIRRIAEDFINAPAAESSGEGSVVYYIDRYSAELPEVTQAMERLAAAGGKKLRIVRGGCPGKALRVLGYWPEAAAAAKKFAPVLSGADTIVVSNPAAYDAFVNDFAEYGVKISAKIMHSSEFIAEMALQYRQDASRVYYLESDFLRNYNNDYPGPKRLLKQLGVENVPFGTNDEESYGVGEGAVVLPLISAELVAKLAAHVEALADDPANDLLITASPYVRLMLGKYTTLNVKTLEELAAERLTGVAVR